MFGIPGWMELGIIAGVVLLLFGRRLPKIMRSLGNGICELKRALNSNSSKIDIINEEDQDNLSGRESSSFDKKL